MDRPSREKLQDFIAGRVSEDEQTAIENYLEIHPEVYDELDDGSEDQLVQRIRAASLDYSSEHAFNLGLDRSKAIHMVPNCFTVPCVYGDYTLTEKLRSGSTSSVFRAIDNRSNQEVAIKILTLDPLIGSNAWDRFQRESSMVSKLSHPNIVRLIDSGIVNRSPFFTMEFLSGFDLSELVSRVGPLEVGSACEIIRQASLALEEISSKGLVHRDVKPSNIFLTDEGIVKLLDLGVARYHKKTPDSSLTDSDQVVGTMDYMAPEQVFDSREADARSDIYGLGCTFYKLLIGAAPFSGREFQNMFRKAVAHSTKEILPLRKIRSEVPERIDAMVRKMCAKAPNARQQSFRVIAESLSRFASSSSLIELVAKARITSGFFSENLEIPIGHRDNGFWQRFRLLAAFAIIAAIVIPIAALNYPGRNVEPTRVPQLTHTFPLPDSGTYSGQNRNTSSNRSDVAYTILSEDVFCYGQPPPSRKIGGIWVRDRTHAIEKLGYYVFRQWPSPGSIVVVKSFEDGRYVAPYFNGPNLESADLMENPSLAESSGEFWGSRISDDCTVDGTYDRGFKSDIHETWKTSLSEFAPNMLRVK